MHRQCSFVRSRAARPARRGLVLTLFALVLLAAVALPATASEAVPTDASLTRLLRYPDIQGDTIVFVYAGDIWTVSAEGGTARRLTSGDGLELFPKLSPDGRWVAFTGEYSGTPQVYVISIDGGQPRQITFRNDVGPLPARGGVDNRVIDWTPDGERIVYLPHRAPWSERIGVPYTVPAAGGMEEPLGPPRGGGGMLSPDGGKLVYTRITREFRTWKRYHGGQAQDVWIYDFSGPSARRLTDYDGTDNQPVWIGDTIYFASDRVDGKLNLFALPADAPEGAAPRQVTHHDTWDVLWVSAGSDAVVYEAGGWIWRFDPATETTAPVPIRVFGDFKGTLPHIMNVKDDIEGGDVSPSGARALFAARGDLFTVPAEHGSIRNLTRSQGVRERDPAWSPDGTRVAYWSDRTGEYELYVRSADGSGTERRVTTDGADEPTWRYGAVWSPDSTKLAYGDRKARLRVIDVASGEISDVDRDPNNDITDYTWSPDGRWLAYSKTGDNNLSSIWVASLDDGSTHRLTGAGTNDVQPAWDPKGRYLYFLSNRDYNLTFSGYEFDFLYTDPTRVYVGLLTDDAPPLFLPKDDEEPAGGAEEATANGGQDQMAKKDGDGKEEVKVAVEPEGFDQRVRAIPGDPGNYGALSGVAAGVLYIEGQGPGAKLQLFDLDAQEEKTILEGVGGYQLAAGGEKVGYVAFGPGGQTYGIAPIQPGQKVDATQVDLSSLELEIDPRAEWHQEYVDAWRILRDWFYSAGMNGVDWQDKREQYEPLVDFLAHRSDLDYILGELGGELSAGHVYVQPNDDWQVPRQENALLGADLAADPSGYFRVEKIFPGENWHDDFRSPLTEPGVDVHEGDLILAIDGVSTKGVDNVFRLLQAKGDQMVSLEVASDASGDDSHVERVRPITRETNLRYLDWVRSRQEYVAKKSNGRIGYIHLPNTAVEGSRELWKGFYAQANKDALILDDRYNGGGFIPFGMIQLLERPLMSYWARRNVSPFTTPGFVSRGPKVMLTNGNAGSGGDALPFYFRQQNLGPVIGTRTWGGLIGVSGNPGLVDGGLMTAPAFRFITPEGMFAVEGKGVAPDIEVIDRPDLVAQGIDPSLDKAIEVLLQKLEENPPKPLVVPEPPGE